MTYLPLEVPGPNTLRLLREELELTQSQMADELGFTGNGRSNIRAWEIGERDGEPFRPTPLAWRYIRLLVIVRRTLHQPAAEAKAYLKNNL